MNPTVVCNSGGRLVPSLRNAGVPVVELSALQSSPSPVADSRTLIQLIRYLRTNDYDIVHCHSTKSGALGRIAATVSGLSTVFTVHGWGFYNTSYDRFSLIVRWGEQALSYVTDAVVCVSEHDRAVGRRHDIIGPTDGWVIHNGIEPININKDRPTLESVCDIAPDRPIVGSIGRLTYQKHPEAVVEVGERLHADGHDPAIVLIGDGPQYDAVARLAEAATADVYMLGFREDAHSLLPDFDVFALPSRFEGLPLTVLECLHVGIPVVATDVGGVSEAIIDGETGHVVAPDDVTTLADCIGALLADPERRGAMSRRCRVVADRFTAERMVAEYDDLYRKLLDDW